jgi:thymidylate synthase (FAD)
MSNKVTLVTVTPGAEALIAYCARVSSPHQDNPEFIKLLRYCYRKGHWSVFEQASMTVKIETSRAISAQILRHSSFDFQEFSQRYSKVKQPLPTVSARRQDTTNRQSSIDDLPDEVIDWFSEQQESNYDRAYALYEEALGKGIAKEQARLLLPIGSGTTMFMRGSIRSWIHYIQVRTKPDTQKEHRDIALKVRAILKSQLPTIGELLDASLLMD